MLEEYWVIVNSLHVLTYIVKLYAHKRGREREREGQRRKRDVTEPGSHSDHHEWLVVMDVG